MLLQKSSSCFVMAILQLCQAIATDSSFLILSEGKFAYQSSTFTDATASKAVDGETNGNYFSEWMSCSHTVHNQRNPWWYVDLGFPSIVSKIVIYNRVDCCQERLSGTVVRVGNDSSPPFTDNIQCGPTITMERITQQPIEVMCTLKTVGQYVTLYLHNTQPLTLCEVQVYKEYNNASSKLDDLVESAYNSITINNELNEFDIVELTDVLFYNLRSLIDEGFYEKSFSKMELIAAKVNLNSWGSDSFSLDFQNVSIELEFNYTGAVTIVGSLWDSNYTGDMSTHFESNRTHYLKSDVLSIATYTEDGTELYPQVQYEIQTINIEQMLMESQQDKTLKLTLVCGFINVSLKEWSTSGCNLINVNVTRAVCRCNHLTSFGPGDQTRKTLSILSTIGVILSIVLLTVTEVVFILLKDLWKSLRNNIHKNLVFNLIVFDVIFLVGIDKVDNHQTCKAIAMTLHLLLMTIFFWMFGEAVFLVFKVIYAAPNRHNRLRNYMISCYAAPLLIVVPIAISEYDAYGNTFCWLDSTVNWVVVVPAAAIALFNTVVLVMLVRIIHHRSGTNVQSSRQQEYKQLKRTIKGTLFMMPINGGMFGPLAMNEESVFMQYLFVIFNSFQGVFIFIIYCPLDNEVKINLKKAHGKVQNQM